MNGPAMLLTTWAPRNRSVNDATSWSTWTMSWSTVSIPGILSSTCWMRSLSRPAAVKGTLYSRRYSQTSRPV